MMKILCAIAVAAVSALAAATVQAAPVPATFATWHMADLHDVTQAWYFTGAALSGLHRDGAPWNAEPPLFRPADAAPVSMTLVAPIEAALPVVSTVPARVEVPPAIPEPAMAPMLLLGLLLICLRVGRRAERFG